MKKLKLSLLFIAMFGLGLSQANACGCSFYEGGTRYEFSWETGGDCNKASGFAIVDSYDSNGKHVGSEYVTISEAATVCG